MSDMGKPVNAIGYVRLSDLRQEDLDANGEGKGLGDQEQRIGDYAARIGWKVTRVIVENDLSPSKGKSRSASAFKRRKIRLPNGRVEYRTVRPGFRASLDLLAAGTHDGFLAVDLDRTVRDPRDLEDMIDVVEEHQVPVESVTGSLRLANDADITMARVMVAVANKESRDKARRVSAARQRQAMAGEFGGGSRRYGFEADGVTVRPAEATVIAECSQRLVQGASLRSMALDLRDRRVPTLTGANWNPGTLRTILLRPRNAGRMIYRGEEIGDAPWAPIVPLETFRAIQRILADPDRRTGPGPAPKWLGTNIYLCGICKPPPHGGEDDATDMVRVHMFVRRGTRAPRYQCKELGHATRNVEYTDKLVVGTVLARLGQPDAVDLLVPAKPDVDVAALRGEAAAIRTNLNELAADKALGLIDRAQLIAATTKGRARLAAIEEQLQNAIVDSPLTPLIEAEDIRAVWDELPLSHQRLVVDHLVTVRILTARRGGRGFDPASIGITWNDVEGASVDTVPAGI